MNSVEKAKQEVRQNYAFFQTQIPKLEIKQRKQYALLHQKQIIEFFDSKDDAAKIGMKDYGEGQFSIQRAADRAIELGYQSFLL